MSSSGEHTGSPNQNPIALYDRIIKASSQEGDLVPFCRCATTIIAADNFKSRWVGIDRRVDARYHIITHLMGIDKKERERIEKYATYKTGWTDKQRNMKSTTKPILQSALMTPRQRPRIIPRLSAPSRTLAQPCRNAPNPCRSVRAQMLGM